LEDRFAKAAILTGAIARAISLMPLIEADLSRRAYLEYIPHARMSYFSIPTIRRTFAFFLFLCSSSSPFLPYS
jgi:hypothetical protein